ncbi:hypothetical protein POKO110462_20095 [Pontibacter korlensis]|uniref:Lipoprotein n=1 Tax=Pontibacter korlensis TaxID=400092 RepID=A0A0E3ZEI5_9BACT|nr:hypothetical protein [Pontibacter korlensis]AKD02994.1 hypothetical protein PKOR_07460 [Pontibacter korlensis]
MRILRSYLLMLLCLVLLAGAGCQRKGIPCPKPTSKRTVKIQGENAQGLSGGIKVPTDKNGRVRKKRGFGLF